MDRATLEEFFDYDGWVWQEIGGAISAQGVDITMPAPGSGWPAVRDCLRHIAYAYDIWLSRMDGRPPVPLDAATITSFGELDAYYQAARERFRAYLGSLSDKDLHADRDVNAWEGIRVYTPAEILGNLVAHDRGHHGDVSTLFYQLSLDMPMIDYRFYVDANR